MSDNYKSSVRYGDPFHIPTPASKPPAPSVGETHSVEYKREYARAGREFAGSDESMFSCGYAYGVIVGKRAAQLQIDRLKARKIDAYALAKELGLKISLNFNEWKMIARAVEAQLKEPRK